MEPVGALGDIIRARASRWRNLAAGGIVSSRRPGCGSYRLIARGDCAETPICFFAEEGDGGVRMFSRAAYRGMATSCARWRRYDRCVRLQQTR